MGINPKSLPSHIRRQIPGLRESQKPTRRSLPSAVTLLGAGHTVRVETGRRVADVATVEGPTRVLGLDLAMGTTGWCMLVGGQPAAHGSFVLPDRLRRKSGEEPLAAWLGRRAVELAEQVALLLRAHRPELVGYEYPDVPRPFYSGGTKGREHAAVQGLSRAEGFLIAQWPRIAGEVPLVAVPVTRVKEVATGRRTSNKDQIRLSLMQRRGWDLTRWTDDEVDAAAVALVAREGLGE